MYSTIIIDSETLELINQAKEVYREHHEDFKGQKISYNFIIKRTASYYIEH